MILFKPKLNLFAKKPDEEYSGANPGVSLAKAESNGSASSTPQEMIDFYNRANARYSSPNWGKSSSPKSLSYGDFLGSQQYKDLEDRYTYNGNKAMNDTLAKVSARTGGLASSYATSAGLGMYNDYMNRLSEAAYEMYKGERDYDRQNALYEYQKEQDALKFGYQKEQDALAQANKERQWDIDAAERERVYGLQDRDDARDQALMYLQMGGQVAGLDPALIEQSGYSKDYLEQAAKYYALQNQPKYTGGGGSRTPKKETPSMVLPETWDEYKQYTGATGAETAEILRTLGANGYVSPGDAYKYWYDKNSRGIALEAQKQNFNPVQQEVDYWDDSFAKEIDAALDDGNIDKAKNKIATRFGKNRDAFMYWADYAGIQL